MTFDQIKLVSIVHSSVRLCGLCVLQEIEVRRSAMVACIANPFVFAAKKEVAFFNLLPLVWIPKYLKDDMQ